MKTFTRGDKQTIRTKLAAAIDKARRSAYVVIAASFTLGTSMAFMMQSTVSAAACPAPPSDLGTLTLNINVPGTATYNVWTRIMVPDATNNSINLQVGGTECLTVNGGTTANTWVWVKNTLAITAGTKEFKYIGTRPGVSVDRIILNSNNACTPTGTGDNAITGACAGDSTGPTVNVTAPANGASVSGTVTLNATANDTGSGVRQVEFLVNGTVIGTDTTSPYSVSWNTAASGNGSRTITARATDNADNVTTSSGVTVTVSGSTGGRPGDLNGDGRTNITDLSILLTNWNRTSPTAAQGDLNGDGRVNITDLSILLSNWG